MTPEETALGAKSQLEQTIEEMTGIQLELQRSQAEIERDLMRDAIVEGLETGLSTLEEAMNTFNANIDALVVAAGGDPDAMDTFSPRRNLVDTMSKHGRFDMMIGGKRSITSAYRTNMLGSGMSDHAAGRAYDLTGQNLGMYQSLVRANGGYADFHGAGGNRHLHVVPGNAPMGDTAVPRIAPIMASSGGRQSAGDTITVNVYPSEGMDEQALASRVIERLDRINRDRSERM
jgi:hypothetical protein